MKDMAKKKELIAKRAMKIGTRVQGPDAQYNTRTMGKQPIAVYPKMKGN